ncbi:MAG: invasion associated locus B family protein [Rhodospirillales bacterium]|nr:invasion associated locus B family protein [Rhodospirillales bacterium]
MKNTPNFAMAQFRLFTGLFAFALLASLISGTAPARASEPKRIGSYTDWNAFTYDEKGGTVCYMVSAPQKAEGKYSKRGDIHVLVTHRNTEKSTGVISIITGYVYKKDSWVEVKVGGTKFELFTDGDKAWARDYEGDRDMVRIMKQGLKMVVKGISNRGTATTDTYSLTGFSAAYDAIGKACGVK